ncbi:MAG TPA: HAD hydrolase-like protein [Candidatus Saccharimonadales bacterium]|nr:HAD hydrolase-like protein [Candidatus Saccharimonadales bacterium]
MAAIIFDFDGTIADSFDFIVDFVTQEAGQAPLSGQQKQELRGQSMAAIARNFGHSRWRLLGLFVRGRRQMRKVIGQVKPFDGITEVIEKLHAEGHELFIVTSNTVPNVHKFLHHYELHKYFLEIYGGAGLFGKTRYLRKLLKEQSLEKNDALYIGDEARDVKAAESVKMRIIAVTWGFARPADLEALSPTAMAGHPEDLIKILEEL